MSCSTCKYFGKPHKSYHNKLKIECEWRNMHKVPFYLTRLENYVYADDGDYCETYEVKVDMEAEYDQHF